MHVIIIGAGTGGLCLAQGLKLDGVSVAVYERDRTRTGGLQGYRVGISPDGGRALRTNLPPELYATFVATCARTPRYFTMLTEKFATVMSVGEDLVPQMTDPDAGEHSVSRMTLRQVLLTGLEDIVEFDKVFTHYEQHDGGVTAYFADGSSATGDVLVGADGANSRVRRQYLPHAEVLDSGIWSVGGKLPITSESRALLSPEVFEGLSMVFAPKGYGCILHVLEFPWQHDGTPKGRIGSTDAELLRAWPGMLFDNTRDYIAWGFWGAAPKFPADFLSRPQAAQVDVVRAMTRGWSPTFHKLLDLTDESTVFGLNIRTSVPVEPWRPSTVTLLGDAIHTMTPGRGIGANTALRDAVGLRRALTAADRGAAGLLAAIGGYEEEMREYGYRAVLESRKQMDGADPIHKPVIGRVMLAMMRTGMRVVERVPALKRRAVGRMFADRGHEVAGRGGEPVSRAR